MTRHKLIESKIKKISWDEFRIRVSHHIKNQAGPRLCRGQSNSNWSLKTSFHRDTNGLTFPMYFQAVDNMADTIGTIEKRKIDTKDREVNASFLAFLQHHGFPTPLLDWTLSPYIAAYFAFSEILHRVPESEFVSIYIFDFLKWNRDWKPIFDYTIKNPHVSLIKPSTYGNKRQIDQQGYFFTWTNVEEIDLHIAFHETEKKCNYLDIYQIPVAEIFYAMSDLYSMGINAFSLFGTTDALCKDFRDGFFRKDGNGKNALARAHELEQTKKE